MKKAMLILLSVAAYTFSLNDVSVPNRFTPSTPARSSEVNANFDTLASRINQNNDTIEQKFIRFSDLESGDSILEKCRIDTARIDHIRSNPEADSMTITKVDINGGAIDGTVIGANSAAAGTFTTVTASGAIAGSTINTGNGAYEIGQSNRTTDSPTFGGLTLNSDLTVGGSIISSRASGLIISTNSIDGADNRFVSLFAGGGNTNRSGGIIVYGNEHGEAGLVRVSAGNGTTSKTGAIFMDGKAYFGARPANDHRWTLALDQYNTLYTSGSIMNLMHNLYHDGSNWRYRYGTGSASGSALLTLAYNQFSVQVADNGTEGGVAALNPAIFTNLLGNTALGKTTFVGGNKLEVEGNALVNGTLEADSIKSTKGINCSTINTGFGNFEIGQNLRTTDSVFFDKTIANDMTVNGTLKADSIKSTKGISCSTINTGFGNFEIGQNLRTTDSVFFDKTIANDMTVNDTIRIGSSSGQQVQIYDGWYLEGNYLCTLSGFTSTVTCTTYYVKCGKAVTLTFSTAAGTSNNYYIHISTGLMPASIRPAREMYWKLEGRSFGGINDYEPIFRYVQTPNNVFAIEPFQTSGGKSIDYSFSISYLTY